MRGIVAAGLVVAMTALAGCTDEPEPRFEEPTETPSASASTTAAAAEPWEEKSKAGAVAFARHWVDVFNDAQTTGETAALQRSSSPNCKTCSGYVDQLRDLYGQGGNLQSKGWSVLVVAPPSGQIQDQVELTVRVDRSPQRVVDADGKSQRYPGGKATYLVELVWREGWRMKRLVRFV